VIDLPEKLIDMNVSIAAEQFVPLAMNIAITLPPP